MHSRTQAHIFHLQTQSYAQHKALQDYYDEIVELIDEYVETYQGKYDILRGYILPTNWKEDDNTIRYFVGLREYFQRIRTTLPQDD